MQKPIRQLLTVTFSTLLLSAALAGDDPAHERHELMEGVRDAVKPVGAMLKGEAEFDQDQVMASLAVFADAAERLGGLVPEGSQGGEAAPAIWEDPAGFQEQIDMWSQATADAIEARKRTLDEAKIALGPVLKSCKRCHDSYRIEDE
jgi:cytochrome c556